MTESGSNTNHAGNGSGKPNYMPKKPPVMAKEPIRQLNPTADEVEEMQKGRGNNVQAINPVNFNEATQMPPEPEREPEPEPEPEPKKANTAGGSSQRKQTRIPKKAPIIHQTETEDERTQLKPTLSRFEPKPVPFQLPSGRHIIDPFYLTENNEIFIRRIGTIEESIFKSIRKLISSTTTKDELYNLLYDVVDKVIDSCLKTNVSIYDFSLIDKLSCFLYVLVASFGQVHDVTVECPHCEEDIFYKDFDVLKDIIMKYVPDDFEYPKKVTINSFKESMNSVFFMYLKYPLISQSEYFANGDDYTIEETTMLLLDRVESDQGIVLSERETTEIIDYLDIDDNKKIQAWLDEFSDYGTKFHTKKLKCKNKECDFKGKVQNLPIEINTMLLSKLADKIQ